jgi:hypothetical protein
MPQKRCLNDFNILADALLWKITVGKAGRNTLKEFFTANGKLIFVISIDIYVYKL